MSSSRIFGGWLRLNAGATGAFFEATSMDASPSPANAGTVRTDSISAAVSSLGDYIQPFHRKLFVVRLAIHS